MDNNNKFRVMAALAGMFARDALKERPEPVSTGWGMLDEKLGGGLMPGLYVLGAVSNLGKSTFALQMAEFIAGNGRDVLYFSVEMSDTAVAAKSVARRVFAGSGGTVKDVHSSDLLRRQDDEGAEMLDRVTREAREELGRLEGMRVFTPKSAGSPMTAEFIFDSVMEFSGERGCGPVVFVDYLQIIPPPEDNRDPRQAIDKNIQTLRRLADEGMIVFVISSLNREAYYDTISMSAFKESGTIEYSADVLLGLEFTEVRSRDRSFKKADSLKWLDEQKSRVPRLVDISILKQRYGESNTQVPFRYYAPWDCFQQACDVPFGVKEVRFTPGAAEPAGPVKAERRTKKKLLPARKETLFKMNNSEFAKKLRFWQTGGESCDEFGMLKVAPFKKDSPEGGVRSYLSEPGFVPGDGKAPAFTTLTYWDMMVADAVFSIYQSHGMMFGKVSRQLYRFKTNDVLRMLSGDSRKPNKIRNAGRDSVYFAIQRSIEKMRGITISIDCADELAHRRGPGAPEGFGGRFLALWTEPGDPEAAVPDTVYCFYDPSRPLAPDEKPYLHMPLYQYVMHTSQVVSVDLDKLAAPRSTGRRADFNDNIRSLTVRHFAARTLGLALWAKGEDVRTWSELHLNTRRGLFKLTGSDSSEAYRIVCAMLEEYKRLGALRSDQLIPDSWPDSLPLRVNPNVRRRVQRERP